MLFSRACHALPCPLSRAPPLAQLVMWSLSLADILLVSVDPRTVFSHTSLTPRQSSRSSWCTGPFDC